MNKEEVGQTPVLDVYLSDFGLTREDLENKRILDLGAGTRRLAFDCEGIGLGKVWSLADSRRDWYPILKMMEGARLMEKDSPVLVLWRGVNRRSVAALMQRLPYADDSFDLILSRDAITHVFDDENLMAEAFLEVVRILGRGGKAYIFPGWLENWTDEEKERVLKALEKAREIGGVMIEEIKREREIVGMKVSGVMLILQKI